MEENEVSTQFEGTAENIESNVNKVDGFNEDISDTLAKRRYPSVKCLKDIPHIIESGASGIWTYRKWSDGTAECWGSKWVTKQGFTQNGALYYTGYIEVPLPTNVFTTIGTVNLCISDPWLLATAIEHNNGNVRFKLIAGYSYSATVSVNAQMYITGKWK